MPKRVKKCSYCQSTEHTRPTCNNVPQEEKSLREEKKIIKNMKTVNVPKSKSSADFAENDSDNESVVNDEMLDTVKAALEAESDDDDEEDATFVSVNVPIALSPKPKTVSLRSGEVANNNDTSIPVFTPPYRYKVGPVLHGRTRASQVDWVKMFWNDEIMDTFVANTNAYATSTGDVTWKTPIDRNELYRFFSIVLYFGVFKIAERRTAWDYSSMYHSHFVGRVMKMKRFEAILRNLHWTNTAVFTITERNERNKVDCFWRLKSFLDILAAACRRHYNCGQNIDGDEQGIPCKGYHSAIQYNGDKPYKWFFKVYCLNDANCGYLSNFYLYCGKEVKEHTLTQTSLHLHIQYII